MNLTLPEGWVMDPLAAARLEHQLATAPPFVSAVLAPLAPLAPGASYRTVAEHLALRPLAAVRRLPAESLLPPGARLDREPIRGGGTPGVVLVDSGAGVHDPSSVDRDLLVASPIGRSPFPRRPMVVLLGADPSEAVLARAQQLTDALVPLDVEARLAVPRVPEGDHLTRPCLADMRSLEVLRPQVVVTLDAGAVELAEAWCGRTRYASIVSLDPDAAPPIEVRPWATTTPGKPLRAIVHPDAPAEEMARLFRRLVAGPQPGPPTLVAEIRRRGPATPTPAHPRAGVRPRPAALRSVGILTGVIDGAGRARIEAIAARLEIRGDQVRRSERADDDRLRTVDVLVLRGLPAEPEVLALVARRRAAARPTVLDLGPDDLGRVDGTDSFGLSGDARALADACGLVTSPSDAWCSELRAAGLAALRLPTPHRTSPPAAPVPALPHPSPTILWVLDPTDLPAAPAAAALEQAVVSLLDDRPGTRVLLCGDPRRWPTSFPVGAGASLRSGDPDESVLGETMLILWTPDGRVAGAAGTPAWLLSAAEREVPTLVARTGAELPSELFPPETAIEQPHEPDAWRHAIGWLLDDDATRRSIGADTRRRACAVDSDEHADRTVQSLLSWALGHDPATTTTGAEQ